MKRKHVKEEQQKPNKKVKGTPSDPNVSHEQELKTKLSKKCTCTTTDHISNLRSWLQSEPNLVVSRLKQLMSLFESFTTGTRLEQADCIYHHLLSLKIDNQIVYSVCGVKLCFNSFALLFCSNYLLSQKIIPSLKANIKPSEMAQPQQETKTESGEQIFEQFFEQTPTNTHFHSFWRSVKADNMLESCPIDGNYMLPTLFTKEYVYEGYVANAETLQIKPFCEKTFFANWSEHYPDIKIRTDALQCDTCQTLENKIAETDDDDDKEKYKTELKLHRVKINEARDYYNDIKMKCKTTENRLLICGDGGDSFGLPRFRVVPKSMMSRPTLQVGCYMVRIYKYSKPTDSVKAYYYLPISVGDAKQSGLAMECFMRTLEELGLCDDKLKDYKVYFCTDNTPKECKNFYFMGFIHNLVTQRKIKSCEYFNLHVGHTHFEVDQAIGVDKRYLRKKDLFTTEQMINYLNANTRDVLNYHAVLLDKCRDWREVIDKHYKTFKNIKQTHRILFVFKKKTNTTQISTTDTWDDDDLTKLKKNQLVKEKVNGMLAPTIVVPFPIPDIVVKSIPSYLEVISDEDYKKWWRSLIKSPNSANNSQINDSQ